MQEQCFAFLVIARHINGILIESIILPLDFIILGEPGTRKSTLVRALLWYANMLDIADQIVLTSYSAKASQNVDVPTTRG